MGPLFSSVQNWNPLNRETFRNENKFEDKSEFTDHKRKVSSLRLISV